MSYSVLVEKYRDYLNRLSSIGSGDEITMSDYMTALYLIKRLNRHSEYHSLCVRLALFVKSVDTNNLVEQDFKRVGDTIIIDEELIGGIQTLQSNIERADKLRHTSFEISWRMAIVGLVKKKFRVASFVMLVITLLQHKMFESMKIKFSKRVLDLDIGITPTDIKECKFISSSELPLEDMLKYGFESSAFKYMSMELLRNNAIPEDKIKDTIRNIGITPVHEVAVDVRIMYEDYKYGCE